MYKAAYSPLTQLLTLIDPHPYTYLLMPFILTELLATQNSLTFRYTPVLNHMHFIPCLP